MSVENKPLVSCICLTHNGPDFLQRSIKCYQEQTYPNKELIVAFTDDNKATSDFLDRINDTSIKRLNFSAEQGMTLGEKRNSAIQFANGFYFCVWDDDDWHNINRLDVHIKYLADTRLKSSILSKIILYDGPAGDAYVSATRWGWEQTLFCEKSIFESQQWRYENVNRGEDSPLVYNLKRSNLIVPIASPYLYIYVYHGNNVFHRGHWEVNLLPWAKKLPEKSSAFVRQILKGTFSNSSASLDLENLFLT